MAEVVNVDTGLYDEQMVVFDKIISHVSAPYDPKNNLIIGAAGGTGKTHTINKATQFLASNGITGYIGAYTGRAASHLRKTGLDAKTLHSVLYKPVIDDKGDLLFFTKKSRSEILESVGDYISIDEGSMVPKSMMDMLISLGVPLFIGGDFMQLPPVDPENKGYNAMFDVEGETVTLEINRRVDPDAEGIFNVTQHLRQQNSIPRMRGAGYKTISKSKILNVPFHDENRFDVIGVGMNKTRKKLNNLVRIARGYNTEIPQAGERVVCLKNSIVSEIPINNGEIYEVQYVMEGDKQSTFSLVNIDNGNQVYVNIYNETWETEKVPSFHNKETMGSAECFAYAYAMSVHKLQGSSIENMLYYDEDVSFFLDQQRFRYTACSRASKSLVVAT